MKKKSLFLAALAALTMATSCSQDEQQSVNKGHAISFNAALDVTRGLDVTTGTLDDFWVNAANEKDMDVVHFRNLQFTKLSKKDVNKWVSASPKYWPDYKVKFHAYAPEATKNGFTVDKGRINAFTVKEKVGDQVDLIAGFVSGSKQTCEKDGVTGLELSHALSKIVFKAKGKNDQYRCEIHGIGIGNVHNKGNYDIERNEWTISQNSNVNYYHKLDKPIVIDEADGVAELTPDGGFKLIPQEITPWKKKHGIHQKLKEAFLYMYVVLTKNEDKTTAFRGFAYIPMPDTSWEVNKEYTYTIDLSKGWGFKGGIKQPDNPDATGPDAPNPDKPAVPDKEGGEKPDIPVVVTGKPIEFVNVSVKDWEKTNKGVTGETTTVASKK